MKAISLASENIRNKSTGSSPVFFKFNTRIAIIIFIVLLAFIAGHYFRLKPSGKESHIVNNTQENCPPPSVVKYNMAEYKYARPLLVVDVLNQGDLNGNPIGGLVSGINGIVEAKKQSAGITDVSVYIQELNTGNFITINPEERYHPASMMKVPVMMVYLRQAELEPGLLNKKMVFKGVEVTRKQNFPPEQALVPGQAYTIKELIYRTIVMSDNDADHLLVTAMNRDLWNKLFADLELPVPDLSNLHYSVSSTEYSRFMRVLYNATYLSNEDADYALSLLVQAKFKEGIQKQLPTDVQVANKFGEFGENDATGKPSIRELHESGIIYIANNPMLVTIMTRGKYEQHLPEVISDISKYVYDQVKNKGS